MLTREFISRYFVENPPKHQFYNESLEIARQLQVHSLGLKPMELLDQARPNEDTIYKEWRIKRYSPKTKPYFQKIINTSAKIRRAEDWSITYKEESSIPDDKSLKKYTEEDFPFFDSVDNWLFSFYFPMEFDDPGRVIAVYPIEKEDPKDDSELYRPYPHVFNSNQVIDFKENSFAVLESEEKSLITSGGKEVYEGRIYFFFDKVGMLIAKQVGERTDWKFEINVDEEGNLLFTKHNFGSMPVWKPGGKIVKFANGQMLHESFASPVIDSWNEAIMDYSDHQVNKALHLHPDRWEIADTPCTACKQKGVIVEIIGDKRFESKCTVCHGNGNYAVKSPFNVKYIKPTVRDGVNDYKSMPTPPMGYGERPIETLEFNKREFIDDIKEGFSAINMEFVMEEPDVNSGIAKSYDQDGLRSYFYMVGKHNVENVLNPIFYYTAKWRYGRILQTEKAIMDNLPVIKVPEKYDIVIASILAERAVNARKNNLNPAIVSNLEVSYARKEFGELSTIPKIMEVANQFDPLFGKTEEDKMVILSNGGCTEEQYILSSQIYSFINWAVSDHKGFLDLDHNSKFKILDKYVQDVKAKSKSNLVPIVDPNGNV
jgi:hypothetical protein